MQLFFPILSFNISASIAREGADNVSIASFIYRKFYPYVFIITFLVGFFSYLFSSAYNFMLLISFSVVLAGIEALHNMLLSVLRVFNKHYIYSSFTLFKTFGFAFISLIFYYFEFGSIYFFILSQIFWYLFVFLIFHFFLLRSKLLSGLTYISNSIVLKYSLLLLPHLVAQWILSSSNRLVVQHYLGYDELGKFNIAFTIGMLVLLLNSGVAVVLPQNFFQRFQFWISLNTRRKYFLIYSSFVAFLQLSVFFLLKVNSTYFNFYDFSNYPVNLIFLFVSSGFYLLGFYFYFVNVLFFYKRSLLISLITLFVTSLSLLVSIFLTIYGGSIGTSYSVFISYLVYYLITMFFSFKICDELKFDFVVDLLLPSGFLLLSYVCYLLF
jgi:O-antigen/teichoic acid export membrane protein